MDEQPRGIWPRRAEKRINPTGEFVRRGLRPGDEFQVDPIDESLIFKPAQRIAIFAEAFLPKIDGVTKTAVMVIRHLQQSGREVIVFTPDNDGNTPPNIGPSKVVAVPAMELPFVPETKLGFPSALVNEHLDVFRPDLIQLFSPAILSMAGVWYGSANSLPVIANYQSDLPGYATRYGMDLLANPIRHALRAIHNASHLTLAPTNTVIRQLREWGFERLRLWGRGMDTRRFNPSKRTDEMRRRMLDGRPDDSLILLYVGRIATEKRVELLHDAAMEDGVALAVIGDGERRSEMERYFGEYAHFMGYMFGDELAEAYASADLFAFTGTNETFGQVVTEAMASGLPVLVPNAGGVVDLVWDGMNGYICQESSGDYREKVAYLRDLPEERARMGEMSLAYAQRFPWTKIMEQLEGYYAEAWEINQEMLNQPQVGFFAQQRVEERQQVRMERQQERQERWLERQRDRQVDSKEE